jgi:hypothetical protein
MWWLYGDSTSSFYNCSSSVFYLNDANIKTISYNLSQFPIFLRQNIRILFIKAEIRQNSGEKEGKTGGFTTDYTDSHRFS